MREKTRMNAMLATALAFGMGNGFSHAKYGTRNSHTVKVKMPPPGCREYFFDLKGNFVSSDTKECVFKCFAINDKNARRKFKKWYENY